MGGGGGDVIDKYCCQLVGSTISKSPQRSRAERNGTGRSAVRTTMVIQRGALPSPV
jgi:hypothetical protein